MQDFHVKIASDRHLTASRHIYSSSTALLNISYFEIEVMYVKHN